MEKKEKKNRLTIWYRLRWWIRRHKVGLSLFVIGVILIVLGVLL